MRLGFVFLRKDTFQTSAPVLKYATRPLHALISCGWLFWFVFGFFVVVIVH